KIHEILTSRGYSSAPTVEDVGTYSIRGGILDVYSPANPNPYRFELFGDVIESIRLFDPITQRSLDDVASAVILPAREAFFRDENRQKVAQLFQASVKDRPLPIE